MTAAGRVSNQPPVSPVAGIDLIVVQFRHLLEIDRSHLTEIAAPLEGWLHAFYRLTLTVRDQRAHVARVQASRLLRFRREQAIGTQTHVHIYQPN